MSEAFFPTVPAKGKDVAELPNVGAALSLDPKLAEDSAPKEKSLGALTSFGILTEAVESGKEKPEEVMEAVPVLFFSSFPFSAGPNEGNAGRAERAPREEDCEVSDCF